MEFQIDAEIYHRLASVALQPNEENPKPILRSVRIEHHNGKKVAISSNAKFVAGYYLGECDDEGAVNITIDQKLRSIAAAEIDQSGSLVITQAPGWTVARGVHGTMYPLNAEVAGDYPEWRQLVPTAQATKSNGTLVLFSESVNHIFNSSPSGNLIFPKFINIDEPIIVRDKFDPNWFALYLVTDKPNTQTFGPATVPEWLK